MTGLAAPATGAAPTAAGPVWLVGTGPGDPGLLTVRAAQLLGSAVPPRDIVLYDNLVHADILALLPPAVERRYVGKRRSDHALPQDTLSALMVSLARSGRRVLRLKGGDPFIFGRGGEELEALVEAGVPWHIVPGITAGTGVATVAGIPLTHRRLAQSCTFVTGHLQDGSMDLDWPALVRPRQTVVVYMGLVGLPTLCAQLIAHGRDPATPAAIVQQGTTPGQRLLSATLARLPEMVSRAGLHGPTLIVVGEVVALGEKLRGSVPD